MDAYILLKQRQQSDLLVQQTAMQHQRFLLDTVVWSWRCIGIKGQRGVGKTTLLLQRLRLSNMPEKGIYLSLDDLHFKQFTLRDTVEAFRRDGLTHFYLDEVHKYTNWSQEIKNLYDFFPDLFIVFTGSSLIELHRQEADLSRRAVMYDLPGLSYREYLSLAGIAHFPAVDLATLLSKHRDIALQIAQTLRPMAHFKRYLREGYYPFFLEDAALSSIRVRQIVNLILYQELSNADGQPAIQVQKIARLLQFLADTTPFKPNFSNISRSLSIDRDTIARYLQHLERAQLIALLYADATALSGLQRPEKVYLDNPNLCFALSNVEPNEGSLRETFFQNQLRAKHQLNYPEQGDFLIDHRYTIEVGGKRKTKRQIAHIPDGFLALDDAESGMGNQVPLWLFGFLY